MQPHTPHHFYEIDDDISKLTKAQMWGKFFLYASKEDKSDFVQELIKANGGIKIREVI